MTDPAPVLEVTPCNLPSYRQNKIGRVARDFELHFSVPPIDTARILIARGIAKWMSVRRQLIKTKHRWRSDISATHEGLRDRGENGLTYKDICWLRGYLAAKMECYAELDMLCKTGRWQMADNDQFGRRLLHEMENGN